MSFSLGSPEYAPVGRNRQDVSFAIGSRGTGVLKDIVVRRSLLPQSCAGLTDWHPNSDEFGFCVSGNALVTIHDTAGEKLNFVVAEGDLFFFPGGKIEAIVNLGGDPAEFVVASHETSILTIEAVTRQASVFAGRSGTEKGTRRTPRYYHFLVDTDGSYSSTTALPMTVRVTTLYPYVDDLSIYSVRVLERGSIEHLLDRESNQLSYVLAGSGMMTVSDRTGVVDRFLVNVGDVFCVPAGHLHRVEAVGGGPLHFIATLDKTALEGGLERTISSSAIGDMISVEYGTRRRSQVVSPSLNRYADTIATGV